jgi:hypothetical protein
MGGAVSPLVDRAAVAEVSAASERALASRGRWIARWLVLSGGIWFFVIVVPSALVGGLGIALHPATGRAWADVVLAALLAAGLVRWERRRARRPPEEVAAEVERTWTQLTRPGWAVRCALLGAGAGVVLGLLVGGLLVSTAPAEELPAGSRAAGLAGFVGVTLLWTVPMAFLIRWVSLRTHRRFVLEAEG